MALITSRTARGRCPVCGANKATCGDVTDVSAVDDPIHQKGQVKVMTEPEQLKEYEYELNGSTVTGSLSAADAEKLGAREVGASASAGAADEKPASKTRTPKNK